MIYPKPSQGSRILPPFRVSLIARHDDLRYPDSSLLKKLILHFLNPASDHGQRREAILDGNITAPPREISVSDMDGDPLHRKREKGKGRSSQ